MLDSLITSKTRVKLILKFFLNPESRSYLRALADEFGESSNAVRVELNRLTDAGLLEKSDEGKTVMYRANVNNSIFSDLHNLAKKFLGLDQVIEEIVAKLGNVELAIITGDYAKGIDSGIIDLCIVGEIDKTYLHKLVEKAESLSNRKIRTLVLKKDEYNKFEKCLESEKALVVWGK
ncbi:MAG: winged helix-turn-helix domain-containing protein [Bacillota bacterium]